MATMTLEQIVHFRATTIIEGVCEVQCWLNSIYDGEDVENAFETINNYTVDEMVNDAERAVMSCWLGNIRFPLSEDEKDLARAYAETVLEDVRAEAAEQMKE